MTFEDIEKELLEYDNSDEAKKQEEQFRREIEEQSDAYKMREV